MSKVSSVSCRMKHDVFKPDRVMSGYCWDAYGLRSVIRMHGAHGEWYSDAVEDDAGAIAD